MVGGGKGFLVTLMFVTILTLGIASILTTLASNVVKGEGPRSRPIRFGWVGIVLLSYFDLFWRSDFLLTIELWDFFHFLAVVTGPIVLLFATQVLLASIAETADAGDIEGGLVSRRFIVLMLFLELWFVGMSLTFTGGLGVENLLDAAFTAALVTMYASRRTATHAYATLAAGAALLTSLAILGQSG